MFSGAPVFKAKQLNAILELDELVHEAKAPSAMRDDLTLHLFNSQNLRKLAQNDKFCAFAFLFPYTLVTIAIQFANLTAHYRVSSEWCSIEEYKNKIKK